MPRRLGIALTIAAALALALVEPVAAAAPNNDTYAGRVTIGSIPFATTLDTTQATTDSSDAELNDWCGVPALDASVWYQLVGTGQDLLVDASESDYSAAVFVAVGSPGSFVTIACDPGGTIFTAQAGVTYTILVVDDQLDGAGNGGTLRLTVGPPPPPPAVDLTVDRVGTVDGNGAATISGTITCDGTSAAVLVSGSQREGRASVSASGFTNLECDTTAQTWSVELVPEAGRFKPGKVEVRAYASVSSEFVSGSDRVEMRVRLHP